jgi:hypothetical protein
MANYTVLDFPDLGRDILPSDILYIIAGTGLDRDRKVEADSFFRAAVGDSVEIELNTSQTININSPALIRSKWYQLTKTATTPTTFTMSGTPTSGEGREILVTLEGSVGIGVVNIVQGANTYAIRNGESLLGRIDSTGAITWTLLAGVQGWRNPATFEPASALAGGINNQKFWEAGIYRVTGNTWDGGTAIGGIPDHDLDVATYWLQTQKALSDDGLTILLTQTLYPIPTSPSVIRGSMPIWTRNGRGASDSFSFGQWNLSGTSNLSYLGGKTNPNNLSDGIWVMKNTATNVPSSGAHYTIQQMTSVTKEEVSGQDRFHRMQTAWERNPGDASPTGKIYMRYATNNAGGGSWSTWTDWEQINRHDFIDLGVLTDANLADPFQSGFGAFLGGATTNLPAEVTPATFTYFVKLGTGSPDATGIQTLYYKEPEPSASVQVWQRVYDYPLGGPGVWRAWQRVDIGAVSGAWSNYGILLNPTTALTTGGSTSPSGSGTFAAGSTDYPNTNADSGTQWTFHWHRFGAVDGVITALPFDSRSSGPFIRKYISGSWGSWASVARTDVPASEALFNDPTNYSEGFSLINFGGGTPPTWNSLPGASGAKFGGIFTFKVENGANDRTIQFWNNRTNNRDLDKLFFRLQTGNSTFGNWQRFSEFTKQTGQSSSTGFVLNDEWEGYQTLTSGDQMASLPQLPSPWTFATVYSTSAYTAATTSRDRKQTQIAFGGYTGFQGVYIRERTFTTSWGAWSAWQNAISAVSKLLITGQTTGDLLRFDGTNWVRVGIGAAGNILTVVGGQPQWVAAAAAAGSESYAFGRFIQSAPASPYGVGILSISDGTNNAPRGFHPLIVHASGGSRSSLWARVQYSTQANNVARARWRFSTTYPSSPSGGSLLGTGAWVNLVNGNAISINQTSVNIVPGTFVWLEVDLTTNNGINGDMVSGTVELF